MMSKLFPKTEVFQMKKSVNNRRNSAIYNLADVSIFSGYTFFVLFFHKYVIMYNKWSKMAVNQYLRS